LGEISSCIGTFHITVQMVRSSSVIELRLSARTRLTRVNFHENEERPERRYIQIAWREKVGTSPLLSHDRENLGTRTQFKGIGYMSPNSFDFLKELSKNTHVIG